MGDPYHTLLAIDFDRHAAAAYAANFPGVEVRTARVGDELDRLPSCDVLLGGFPCQPHSHAGKRLASADERDGGADFGAAIRKTNPRMFLGENVPGILSSEGGRYVGRLVEAMEDAGYDVEVRCLDAVNFGAPQFRDRAWFWGVRRDLMRDGCKRQWPRPTHAWPPPEACMFGGALLPGVTVGEALGLDGTLHRKRGKGMIERAGGRRDHPTAEPCPSITSAFALGGGGGLFIQSHADPAQTVNKPSPALRSGGDGHDGCCVRLQVIGGGRGGGPGHAMPDRDITDEPCQTVTNSGGRGGFRNGEPRVQLYRWSDAMLRKHPPASPASPAPTVLGKFYKGGAEGLLDVSECLAGHDAFGTPVKWKQKGDGLWVRRLTPLECLRLQSGPDDFRWPEGISKTAQYRIVGNGWASVMGAVFAKAFAATDSASRSVVDLYCGGGLGAVGWHGRHWKYTPAEQGRASA